MSRIARKMLAALAVGTLFAVGAFAWSPSTAGAQGLDLCDLLGDPYCPEEPPGGPGVGPGDIECPGGVPVGSTGSCAVDGVDVGDEVTATLTCGGQSAVVFQGVVDEVPFSFDFAVPAGFPSGPGTLTINGGTVPFECTGGGSTLARTGSDAGPMIGIGAGLVAIGVAAAYGARRRLRSVAV